MFYCLDALELYVELQLQCLASGLRCSQVLSGQSKVRLERGDLVTQGEGSGGDVSELTQIYVASIFEGGGLEGRDLIT